MRLFLSGLDNDVISMSYDEILEGFVKSKYSKKLYPLKTGLKFYIASVDGLNASYKQSSFDELLQIARIREREVLDNETV